eukprot:6209400-Pleurochrysis_carterae.AAC.1
MALARESEKTPETANSLLLWSLRTNHDAAKPQPPETHPIKRAPEARCEATANPGLDSNEYQILASVLSQPREAACRVSIVWSSMLQTSSCGALTDSSAAAIAPGELACSNSSAACADAPPTESVANDKKTKT